MADMRHDWKREEVILAMDFYVAVGGLASAPIPGQHSAEIAQLSRLLRQLGADPQEIQGERYRNPDGVYLKMMNLRAVQTEGQHGMGSYSRMDAAVWREYIDDLPRLREEAAAIRVPRERQPGRLVGGSVMRWCIRRGLAAVAASAAVSVIGVTGAGASGARTTAAEAANSTTADASHMSAIPGAQLWVKRYNGTGDGSDSASRVAVSPDGSRVFVTGWSAGTTGTLDYATAAYSAATGAQLWVKRYNGPANGDDYAYSVAVSPGGGKVFVTGQSLGTGSGPDYATVAYNAATGKQLWVKRYNGPANGPDSAYAVAVSPAGGTVFVTGESTGATSQDYTTIAYSTATGAQMWIKRYNGPAKNEDYATSVAVSPGGGKVFVTGYSIGTNSGPDYATLAYNAATGKQLWVKRYNGPANYVDGASSVAVSPDGKKVFVTGQSTRILYSNPDQGVDYATIAYSAATGAQLWVKRYNGPSNGQDYATSVAVIPTGGKVFVTGVSPGTSSGNDYATVAYNAATGAQLWVKRYNGPANAEDDASSVAVSPDGKKVFVTGGSSGTSGVSGGDYATVAYSAATGAQLWVSRYNGPGNGQDFATSVAVSPAGGKVFVTGASTGAGLDYTTIAYKP